MTQLILSSAPTGFIPDCETVYSSDKTVEQSFDNGVKCRIDLTNGDVKAIRGGIVFSQWKGITIKEWSDILYSLQNL